MKYAILAAGEGSRLAQEGITAPKPLVKVGGERLIDRLLRVFTDCGAESVAVICNALTDEVFEHLNSPRAPKAAEQGWLTAVQQTTPSSMHSLSVLAPHLRGGKFIATTVDTIFDESEFAAYANAFERSDADGMMVVTDYVDDEKPLWVEVDDDDTITGFHDTNDDGRCHLVSGGIYGLSDRALDILDDCLAQGKARMRNYQRELVARGLRLKAVRLTHVMDIDHADDIAKAEETLSAWKKG